MESMQVLKVKRLRPEAVLPRQATEGAAGYDLCACLAQPLCIPAGERVLVPTGLAIAIEDASVAAFVFGRSGLAIRHGLVPANAVGVIDADYRGELMVALANQSSEAYTVLPGERIAQLVFMPVLTPILEEAKELPKTQRDTGGFGSTGQ